MPGRLNPISFQLQEKLSTVSQIPMFTLWAHWGLIALHARLVQ
jgi:hypothetical protein